MKELFDSYLTIFMHPFRVYDLFWEGIPLPGRELSPIKRISLTEAISVSWLITIVRAFFDLLLLNFAISAVSSFFTNNDDLFSILGLDVSFAGYYFFLLKMIIEVLLFPILTYAWVLFWEFFLKNLGNYLEVDEIDERVQMIVSNSLTTNFIRIIPIFGDIAQGFLSTIHIYAGIKKSFGLSSRASFLAISLPFLLISFFFTFIVVCLVLAIL